MLDMISQLELEMPEERRKPGRRVSGIFWIILLNIGVFVADHFFQVVISCAFLLWIYLYVDEIFNRQMKVEKVGGVVWPPWNILSLLKRRPKKLLQVLNQSRGYQNPNFGDSHGFGGWFLDSQGCYDTMWVY